LVRWLGTVCDGLVLGELISTDELERAVRQVRTTVTLHMESELPQSPEGDPATDGRGKELSEILQSDHRWFVLSLDEFDALLGVVLGDDHGGHRQALGQYGRLLAAALTRHRRDELEYERLMDGRPLPAPRNAN
jgi:hypothetical protein